MTDTREGLLLRRRLLAAAFLLVGVAGVVWLALSTPAETYVAGVLSRVLGRPVQIEEFGIRLGRSVEFDLRGVRVFESDQPGAPAIFEVRKARGRQGWPRLLTGQLLPRHWELDQPTLRVGATGAPGGGSAALPELPQMDLIVRGGRVEWSIDGSEQLVARDLDLSASRGGLGTRARGTLSAQLLRGETPAGMLSLEFTGWTQDLQGTGRVDGLDLSTLSAGRVRARGRGAAEFAVALEGDDSRLSLTLNAQGLSLELPDVSAALKPRTAQLALELQRSSVASDLAIERLVLDDVVLSGKLRIEAGAEGRIRGDLALADFDPSSDRLHPLRLMALRFASWEGIVSRFKAGRIEEIKAHLDLPRVGLRDSLLWRRRPAADELSLSLRVRDAVFGQGSGSPLRDISGRLELRGNVIEAHDVRMTRDGRPLPVIDASVDGMHRLVSLGDERALPHGPGVPTPGLSPALATFAGGASDEPRPPTRIEFSQLSLGYPAFILPLRDASGVMVISAGRVLVEGARGVLGGAPAELDVDWNTREPHVQVAVRYLDGEAPPRATPDGSWLDARLQIDTFFLGKWRIDVGELRLHATGDRAELTDIQGALGDGTLIGSGAISLDRDGMAPYAFGLQLIQADAEPLSEYIGLTPGSVTGTVSANGTMGGALAPGRSFVDYGELKLAVQVEKGTLGRLPAALAIARLPSLQGVSSLLGRPLPYRQITTELKLESGTLEIAKFKLSGPELRILADGVIDLRKPDQPMDMIVALLFLETVDKLLGSLPFVRDVVLGDDRNLLATYFHVQGPRADPSARILPPDAFQTATGVISGGMRRLGSLIGIGRGTDDGERPADPSP